MQLETMVAVFGLAVPVVAAVWEFMLAGRKRLGYRVQMETTADGAQGTSNRSFVLLRFQNSGWTAIDSDDYIGRDGSPVGIHIAFPDRRVVDVSVTECSDEAQWGFFEDLSAFGPTLERDAINLPKVQLNRGWYYKVLVTLERVPGTVPPAPPGPPHRTGLRGRLERSEWYERRQRRRRHDPLVKVTAAIKNGGRRRIRWTDSHTYASPGVAALVTLLVMVAATQSVLTFTRDDTKTVVTPPLDCAEKGVLRLSGSTAFQDAVAKAATAYERRCLGQVRVEAPAANFVGSGTGLSKLDAAGKGAKLADGEGLSDQLAFSDTPLEQNQYPELLPGPVALSMFTLVASKDARVQNLSVQQIRDLYAGRITNWKQVNGADLPVHLVSRNSDSGTRTVLVDKVLGQKELPGVTTSDCAALAANRAGRCEVKDTRALLDSVSRTPGALGHAELSAALATPGVVRVRIGGIAAEADGAAQNGYPYWQTENAYSYGEPPADSPAAGFLLYLTKGLGAGVLRQNHFKPCIDFDSALKCAP
ncbi:PstS family phosphate ABC transporter substrate-binding protein [Streptomyces sp. NPDC050085]|uniref:PstS family phosphate ABC transporter substrate-binding protein n=1 Tax=Streptomyces sp. NPDC050085 TaxID=3365600 RepID=UPI003799CCAA